MEQQVLQGIPEVFPTSTTKEEPPISQYIWKGQNYPEKVWRDADFLDEVELLKRVYPLEDLKSNPLLLSNRSVFALLTTVQEGYRDSSGRRVTDKSNSRTSSPSPPVPSLMMSTTMPPRSKLAVGLELADRKLIRQPLVKLRGKKELLKDAQSAGEGMNEHLRELRFQAQYTDHPFNNTWKGVTVPSPDDIPVATL